MLLNKTPKTLRVINDTNMTRHPLKQLAFAAALTVGSATLHNACADNYVPNVIGIDNLPTLSGGVYDGLPNPNYGRLSFLYAHHFDTSFENNHYHGIGIWTYSGPANAAVATNSNSGNRIPETYYQLPPLTLVGAPATLPAFAGRLVSIRTDEHYSDRRLRPTSYFQQFPTNSSEWFSFRGNANRFTNSLAGTKPALELISKTPGLSIGVSTNASLLNNAGDRLVLGEGDSWEAWPLFSTAVDAAPGTYTVAFKLVDLNAANSAATESGVFYLDFRVPEAPTLVIEESVKITLPLVTDGYVLQYAPTASGPWTDYTDLQSTAEESGTGEASQQTFRRYYTVKRTGLMQFFRMHRP